MPPKTNMKSIQKSITTHMKPEHILIGVLVVIVICIIIFMIFNVMKSDNNMSKDNLMNEMEQELMLNEMEGRQTMMEDEGIYESFYGGSVNNDYRNQDEIQSFDPARVADTDIVLVKFYAPWCGHCKTLAPSWSNLTQKMNGSTLPNGKKVYIVKLDADKNSTEAQKHGVQGFPTIKVFNKGQSKEYQGGRSMNDLEQFVNSGCGYM